MEAKFLTGNAIREAIECLMNGYDEYHWAVAWGSETPTSKALLAQKAKFRSVTIGVAFAQTDPRLVDALVDVPGAFLATDFSGGTYHPKLFCFRTGDNVAAVVGSANFTNGGLGPNLEAAVALTGTVAEPAFIDMFEFLREAARHHRPITATLAASYRASYKRFARLPRPPRDPLATMDRAQTRSLGSALTSLTWRDFRDAVHHSGHHDVNQSLELLAIAQRWLVSVRSFGQLTAPQRKAIAGIIGDYQKTDPDLDRDWGWFGSMKGAGDFANRIDANDSHLARAVDAIPMRGEVKQADYDRFCTEFIRAFSQSSRQGGVATASRLLALKRPDSFLCLCKPNIGGAAKQMGFAPSTLALNNYWDKVVEVLRASEWYAAPRPTGADAVLWDNRAAMLDTIFYTP
jgi:hypothetical protein